MPHIGSIVALLWLAQATPPVEPLRSIRDVNFQTLTYQIAGQPRALGEDPINPDFPHFRGSVYLLSVLIGDLGPDAKEEAAVVIGMDGGGSGRFTFGFLYGLRNGKPVVLDTFKGGDRADGGIHEVRMDRGLLAVVRNYGQAACCEDYRETTWYRWDGKQLRRQRSERRPVTP